MDQPPPRPLPRWLSWVPDRWFADDGFNRGVSRLVDRHWDFLFGLTVGLAIPSLDAIFGIGVLFICYALASDRVAVSMKKWVLLAMLVAMTLGAFAYFVWYEAWLFSQLRF